MKKIQAFLLTIICCFVSLFSTGCNLFVDFDYNIDFVVDGEVVATVGTNGDKIAMPKNPVKEDYAFDGWYWDEGEWNDKFTLNSILDQPLEDKNHYKVYAKFKSTVYYTVIFVDNFTDEGIPQQIKKGEKTALRLNTFTRKSYKFTGWTCSGKTYADGEEVLDICEVGESVYMYSKWKFIETPVDYGSYTILFDANGGKGKMDDITVDVRDKVVLPANAFTRKYYDFAGWCEYPSDGEERFKDGETVNELASKGETVTLYAVWKKHENVSFIYYLEDLQAVRNNPNGTYVLQNDLDCQFNKVPSLSTGTAYFNGTFDGNGFEIKFATFEAESSSGGFASLFGIIGERGVVKNLGVAHCDTTPDTEESAIFAVQNLGKIENCYAYDCVAKGGNYDEQCLISNAGLVLANNGTIKNCYFEGALAAFVPLGKHHVSGGICVNNYGTIENCIGFSNVSVLDDETRYGRVDAIAVFDYGTIKNCYYDKERNFELLPFHSSGTVQVSFSVGSNFGSGVSEREFNNRLFYVNTLGWSESIWDFSNLDYWVEQLPVLKK
ncbi:MAG: InlB B-repeat-containing protein [Candidatus Borkfalkiaceae bacterium]|nr:InlB B-repeat-containing protein [Christensenellaceae bacterium]